MCSGWLLTDADVTVAGWAQYAGNVTAGTLSYQPSKAEQCHWEPGREVPTK